ncbi:Planctomycete cytochrome C [Neorhodopirellula lusitana]|uniref:Planctomycete cytochrome C n=1 Tax=Neorhodopirellula lusitana TaxID=445327 RepID=A0ABY1Q8B9_9BACT|nr:DUF1592 domain-containing protein [Neorhodopirellula lusitana]SMP61980.1 Planctomycete cytochrome C [Neorhodopirellula lusitana]
MKTLVPFVSLTRRGVLSVGLLSVLVTAAGADTLAAAETSEVRQALMTNQHVEVFAKYCLDCHSTDASEAGVDLEGLPLTVSQDIATANMWQKVLNAINSGEMPPEDSEPMTDADKAMFLEALTDQMVIARKILGDSGGVIPLRRLNRREYENTVESLLGVRPDVSSLPDDQVGAGFDTQGASLFFSSDQLENYLETAKAALRLCLIPAEATASKTRRVEPETKQNEAYQKYLDMLLDQYERSLAWQAQDEKPPSEFGILDEYQAKKNLSQYQDWSPQLKEYLQRPETKTGVTLMMTIKAGGYTTVKLPTLFDSAPGKYTIRLRAAHYPGTESRFHYVELSSGYASSKKRVAWRKVTATLDEPEILTFEFDHKPGQREQLWLHQRTHQDRADKNLWTIHQKENGLGTPPGVWIDWAEVSGPEPDLAPTEAAQRILFERPEGVEEDRYAVEVLRRFAVRAFRGTPPDREFLKQLFGHYDANRKAGQTLVEALIDPLAITLSSPQFLYMVEEDREDTRQLSDTELAVRLSYLIWSSQPDDELIRVAMSGQLSDPAMLDQQLTRMLADAQHSHFVRDFVHQWLSMERLGMFQFDGVQFRSFDNATRENAREEIYQLFMHVMHESLPLGDLLKADYVVVNDVMADYYGLDPVQGHEFRKVPLPAGSPRGGLLGTAAVSAMGSDGLRSSPVERGAWVLRHLLNDPPAPAPPNVPQLGRLAGEVLSARELQKAHQEEPQCAQCHRKIDPIGYGLENFDVDGMWRNKEKITTGKARRKKIHQFDISPSGQLPDGTPFASYFELRDAISTRQDDFARGFTEALIAYGLGRPYGFTDQDLADQILSAAKAKNYSVRAFLDAFVHSRSFQSR